MFLLNDGTEITHAQITDAVSAGKARLIYCHGDGRTKTGLLLDGIDRDTRGQCYSMWEEVWTAIPETAGHAIQAAYCEP